MTEQPVIVQKISWINLCPWILIFKTFSVASGAGVLAFALLGVVLSPLGWILSENVFLEDVRDRDPKLIEIVETNGSPYRGVFAPTSSADSVSLEISGVALAGPQLVFRQIEKPFEYVFSSDASMREFAYFAFGGIWTVLVWSFAGLAIARISLLRLTRNERVGIDDAFGYAISNWRTAVGAIGIPLLAVLFLCVPGALIGLLMNFDFGIFVAAGLWLFVLLFGGLAALLLLGLMFGWPLMVASVGCEGQNAFDAMTRGYAYTFQRPFHYAFYALVAMLVGSLAWLVIGGLTQGVVDMSGWSSSWGANISSSNRFEQIIDGVDVSGEELSRWRQSGHSMIHFFNSILKTLAAAFLYGLFWCMASAIYLVLRYDVDETEMDEIFLVDEKRTYQLPPLKTDTNGIPQVQKSAPAEGIESPPSESD
ncbi:MAG: hypothetical protein ACKVHR_06435 [Pirellulales bacterium]